MRSALDAPVLPPHGQTADTAPADVQRNMKASEIDSIEVASVVVGATRDNIVQAMKGMEGVGYSEIFLCVRACVRACECVCVLLAIPVPHSSNTVMFLARNYVGSVLYSLVSTGMQDCYRSCNSGLTDL